MRPPPRALRKLLWAASALAVVASVRAGLSCLGYARLKRLMPKTKRVRAEAPQAVLDRCAWALTRASRIVPGASCLTQALAGQWLLARLGFASQVAVGVRPEGQGSLAAHAWLTSSGRVVVGGTAEDLTRFTRLLELGSPN